MRKPLGADQTVTITHIIRKGTASESYTTVLSGVSCREVSSAHVAVSYTHLTLPTILLV